MNRLALQDALGAPVVARTRPRGAVWINEPFAILALREAFARRKPERRTLRRLFTALRSVAFAYFSWADPLPFLDFARASLQSLRGASAAPAGRPARNVTIGGRRPQLPRSAGGAVAS
jgi:hypothetical protein